MPTKIELHCGDCLDILPQLKAKSVDVCCCSPPYNIGTKYSKYQDKLTEAEYLDFIYRVAAAIYRILKPNGSFFLNVAGTPTRPHLPFRIAGLLAGNLFKLQNPIHWIKSISIGNRTYGHFKPINSRRVLHSGHEYIFHFTKTGEVELNRLAIGVPYTDKTNISRRNHRQDRRCRGNVWFIPYNTVQHKADKFNHPASFPVKLPRMCIRLHGVRRAVVLDPFCGTGATLLAARREKCRRAIGIDIDKSYVKITQRRCRGK